MATNLHADIISDLAAALSGSLGIGPTANINPEKAFPSMFEPIHGSAFELVGKDLANPLGAFCSCVMMLEHLQENKGASLLMSAIEEVCQEIPPSVFFVFNEWMMKMVRNGNPLTRAKLEECV